MPDPHRGNVAPSVAERIVLGDIERVAPNPAWINEALRQALSDLRSAERDIADNPRRAFINAYDAARISIECHLNASGLRIRSGPGAHRITIEYAQERMADLVAASVLDTIEIARTVRNAAEYPFTSSPARITEGDSIAAREAAHALNQAVIGWWREQSI